MRRLLGIGRVRRPSSSGISVRPASTHAAHVHGPACSHPQAATPAAVPTPPPATSPAAAVASSSSPASPLSGRPLPPPSIPGQMPPADHPLLPGWYQRPLPPALVPFSSNRGKQLFKEALASGGGEGYFALAEQFQTQSTPSYCGPGTLAMVLNALALDPKRVWKGNWRWFSEEMLETCDARKSHTEPLAGVENEGLSFEEFLFLAECNGAHVRAFRAAPEGVAPSHTGSSASLSRFRAAIHSATHRTDLHLVASFSRKVLGQTGSGHYSPVGAYHPESDMALVLDVARFKYPPYWAPVPLLWKAVCALDEATGHGRGYYLMSKAKLSAPVPVAPGSSSADAPLEGEHEANIFTPLSTACRIAVDKLSWSRLAEHFCSVLPKQLQQQELMGKFTSSSNNASDPAAFAPLDAECGAVFREVLHSLPVELSSIFIMYTHDLSARMVEQYQRLERSRKASAAAESAQAGVSTTAAAASASSSAAGSCDASHSCQVHTPSSTLSIYHTLLPKHTPHTHSHSIPTVHALHPLLHAIAQTQLFQVLRAADIDLQAVEYQRQRAAHAGADDGSHSPTSSPTDGVTAALPSDASAEGGLGFHLLASSADGELELAALLLLACPQQVFSLLRPDLQARVESLRRFDLLSAPLQTEVRNLRAQMGILADFCACGAAPSVHGNDSPNVDPRDVADNERMNRHASHTLATALHGRSDAETETRAEAALAEAATIRQRPTAKPAPVAHAAHRFVAGARKR